MKLKMKHLVLITQVQMLLLTLKSMRLKKQVASITNLVTTTALISAQNKIPNVSNLVKETDYNTKINEIEKKC